MENHVIVYASRLRKQQVRSRLGVPGRDTFLEPSSQNRKRSRREEADRKGKDRKREHKVST